MEDVLKAEVASAVQRATGCTIEAELEHPAELAHGDWASSVALALAKEVGEAPRALAERIVAELGEIEGVATIEVAGPGFINLHLDRAFFTRMTDEVRERGRAWGRNERLKGQTWVIEHTSPNPNKAMHIGHLRNNVTGMALVRLSEACGAHVIADAVDNNRGIAIAKLMWGYLRFAHVRNEADHDLAYWFLHQDEWHTPESAGQPPDRFVDELYVKGSRDCEADPAAEAAVRQLVVAWEAGEEKTWALWERVLSYSHDGQARTLARLGSRWDRVWHEHEHYQKGKDLVETGLAHGVFKRLPDGAILTNLEAYGIPDTIVEKNDGTSLYITQDLALTKLKKETYEADCLIWVVGPDQSLAMRQVFAVCEQLDIGSLDEFVHVAYGYMSIKGAGKMSSRKGNVLYIDEVIDATREASLAVLAERDLPEKAQLAETIALGAIKYAILRSGRMRDIAFDQEAATQLEGDTGPYLQYAATRARSVLRNAAGAGVGARTDAPPGAVNEVERLLYRFPEVVDRAQRELEPHHVAQFLLTLAGAFNSWYAAEQIVAPEERTSPYRVALTEAFLITMENGLGLLGIDAPERM
ncbi:arginine--tRNA ligase [Patescibacteria group bacterium]|jgi:arginyl-tRNA synthetase|nr:arginine--tRNA ligase [Patescibacteria group bacterium]